jgi:prophage regulatory protein
MSLRSNSSPSQPSISRLRAAMARTGLSRAVLYKLKAEGKFPASIQLSARSIGFLDSDIDAWIAQRVAASRAACAKPEAVGSPRKGGITLARSGASRDGTNGGARPKSTPATSAAQPT